MTMQRLLTIFATMLIALTVAAQANKINPEDRPVDMNNPTFVPMMKVGKVQVDGDSIPYVELNRIYCYPPKTFTDAKQREQYTRMVRNVKRVLPIAKEIRHLIVETYEYLQTLPDKKSRDAHMKLVEKGIKEAYTPRMKKLTLTQGKLLIKLVYRECDSSGYELVQAFLGPIKAGMYQAFAWVFGASLKKKYEPQGDDAEVERLARLIEAGQL